MKKKTPTDKQPRTSAERSKAYRDRRRAELAKLRAIDAGEELLDERWPLPKKKSEVPELEADPQKNFRLPAPRETIPIEAAAGPLAFADVPPLAPPPAPEQVAGQPAPDQQQRPPVELAPGVTLLDAPPAAPPPPNEKQMLIAGGLTMLVKVGTRIAVGYAGAAEMALPAELVAAAKTLDLDLSNAKNLGDAAADLAGGFYFEHAMRALQKVALLSKSLPYEDEIVTVAGPALSIAVIFADAKRRAAAGKVPARPPAAAQLAGVVDQVVDQQPAAEAAAEPAKPVKRSAWAGISAGDDMKPADPSALEYGRAGAGEGGLDDGPA